MNKMSQDDINFHVEHTFPPDVKVRSGSVTLFDFGYEGDYPNLYLFAEELEDAAYFAYRDSDTRILEALRQKWPEAVEAGWSVASKKALQSIKRQGEELSADGVAALAAMTAVEPTPTTAEREPARMAAMA